MSRSTGSHNYYKKPYDNRSERLPPLKEVLGDIYDTHARPAMQHTSNSHVPRAQQLWLPSLHYATMGYSNHPYDMPEATAHRPQSHSGSYNRRSSLSRPPSGSEANFPRYEYGLFKTTAGELIHERSSLHDDFPLRSAKATDDPSKRYACDACPARFDRPNGLETHKRSHSGEKPFGCPFKGCTKTFHTSSNMRRHQLTHDGWSAFEPAEQSTPSNRSRSSRSSKSPNGHTSSTYYHK